MTPETAAAFGRAMTAEIVEFAQHVAAQPRGSTARREALDRGMASFREKLGGAGIVGEALDQLADRAQFGVLEVVAAIDRGGLHATTGRA